MTNIKNTKRALLVGVLSIALCLAMLVGATFAWFTDSVTSGNNRIVAGNLDVELEYAKEFNEDGSVKTWESVQDVENIFNPDALWEPGHAEVAYLRLRNAGTLALKYKFAMNIKSESSSYNKNNESFKLSTYLKYGIVKDRQAKFETRDGAINAVINPTAFSSVSSEDTFLNQGDERYIALVVFMPTTVGNEANWYKRYSWTQEPSIQFDFNLIATQTPHENDSFGNNYDAAAFASIWDGKSETNKDELLSREENGVIALYTAADFVGAFNNATSFSNKTLLLEDNISLNNNSFGGKNITNVILDGNGHTISGLNTYYGLFYNVYGDSVIRNLTLEGEVNGNNSAAFVSRMHGNSVIENCVSNVNVTSTSKSGGIVNMTYTNSNVVIKSCVNNGTVNGVNAGVGGIVGYVNKGTTVEGCVNNGTVNGGQYVGGIAGYVTGGESIFRNCVNKGSIAGATVGGIASIFTSGNSYKIVDCRNEGALNGTASTGELLGLNNAATVEVEYTEKAEVVGNPVIAKASGNTTLRNIIGDVVFSTADGGSTKLVLENSEIKTLTTTGGVPAQGSHWKTILQDETSYIDTLNITAGTSCVKVPAGAILKLGSYTGALVGIDGTSKIVLDGVEKIWNTTSKSWE